MLDLSLPDSTLFNTALNSCHRCALNDNAFGISTDKPFIFSNCSFTSLPPAYQDILLMLPQVFYIINTLDYPFIYDLQLSVAAILLTSGLPSRCCIFKVFLFSLSCSDCFRIKSLISLAFFMCCNLRSGSVTSPVKQ